MWPGTYYLWNLLPITHTHIAPAPDVAWNLLARPRVSPGTYHPIGPQTPVPGVAWNLSPNLFAKQRDTSVML